MEQDGEHLREVQVDLILRSIYVNVDEAGLAKVVVLGVLCNHFFYVEQTSDFELA